MKKGGTKKSTDLPNLKLRAHDISFNFNKHFGDVLKTTLTVTTPILLNYKQAT
jgi:hypothetical protein